MGAPSGYAPVYDPCVTRGHTLTRKTDAVGYDLMKRPRAFFMFMVQHQYNRVYQQNVQILVHLTVLGFHFSTLILVNF